VTEKIRSPEKGTKQDGRRNNRIPNPKRDGGGRSKKLKPGQLPAQIECAIDNYFHPSCMKNQRKALLMAGYAETTAKYNPHQVFGREDVKAEIARREAELAADYKLTEERVIRGLLMLAEASPGAIIMKLQKNGWNLEELTPEELYQISEFTQETYKIGRGEDAEDVLKTKIKAESRRPAFEALARIGGFNKDKLEVKGDVDLVARIQAGRDRLAGKTESEQAS